MVYSVYYDDPGCPNCMEWSDLINDWVPDCEVEYVITNSGCSHVCGNRYLTNHPESFILIEGSWYSTDFEGLIKNDDGEWQLKESK